MATSLKNLQQQAQTHIQDLGSQIDEAFDQHAEAGTKISPQPILDRLAAEKQNYTVDGVPINDAYVQRLGDLEQQVKDVAEANGGDVPLASLRRIRQIHDEQIAKSKGGFALAPDAQSGVDALKTYSDAIRSVIAETDPELAATNKEFSFWKNVDKVAGDSLLRKTGQRSPLTQKILEGAGTRRARHSAAGKARSSARKPVRRPASCRAARSGTHSQHRPKRRWRTCWPGKRKRQPNIPTWEPAFHRRSATACCLRLRRCQPAASPFRPRTIWFPSEIRKPASTFMWRGGPCSIPVLPVPRRQ
ncbi:MAG: hypothetical protein ACRD4O_10410 [Bryobacteraceae bacterium]